MSPSWLYVPQAASFAASPKYTVNADILSSFNPNRFNLSNYTESGPAVADFAHNAFLPIRFSPNLGYVEVLLRTPNSGSFGGGTSFTATTTNQSASFSINSNSVVPTSVTFTHFRGSLIIRFAQTTTYLNNYLSGVSAGDPFLFQLFYT